MRKALADMPKGVASDSLNVAYEKVMERIDGQIPVSRDLARQVLMWIVFAKEPLSTLQLRHALGVELEETGLDPDNLPEVDDLLSVCAGLVTVDNQSDIFRLVHYTTQTYLREKHHWIQDAESVITQTCLAYLSFDDFGSGRCGDGKTLHQRWQEYPLYTYVASNWGLHLNAASEALRWCLPDFLNDEDKVQSCAETSFSRSKGDHIYRRRPGPHSLGLGIHLAIFAEAVSTVIILLRDGDYVECKDPLGRTPLWLAASIGEVSIVNLLLDHGAAVDTCDLSHWTPLMAAATKEHDAVVGILLEAGADPNARLELNDSVLSIAIENGTGNEEIVKLLLKAGASPTYVGRWPDLSLYYAAEEGYEGIVSLLLDAAADPKAKGGHRGTALHVAASHGHEGVVRLLLTAGADINAEMGKDGTTALHKATAGGHEKVVRHLLSWEGILVNVPDNDGHTPLYFAVLQGFEEICRLLLARDDIDTSCTDRYASLLMEAAKQGHVGIASHLLTRAKGDPRVTDCEGNTILAVAVDEGHYEVVQLFVNDADVDLNYRNRHGNTPLNMAASKGFLNIVDLLLAQDGIDVDSRDDSGSTTPTLAVRKSEIPAVERLPAKSSAEANFWKNKGSTPLAQAAYSGHLDVVETLLKRSADVLSCNNDGHTPLDLAAAVGYRLWPPSHTTLGPHPEVVDLLRPY